MRLVVMLRSSQVQIRRDRSPEPMAAAAGGMGVAQHFLERSPAARLLPSQLRNLHSPSLLHNITADLVELLQDVPEFVTFAVGSVATAARNVACQLSSGGH